MVDLRVPVGRFFMMANPQLIPGPTDFEAFQSLFNYYRDALRTFETLRNTYGDIFQLKFWKYHVIHLSHPQDIRAVLQSRDFEITPIFSPAEPLIGKGLATNTGEDWAKQRQMIRPAFHDKNVEQYLQTLHRTTQEMLTRWDKCAQSQQPFDLATELVALNQTQLSHLLFREPMGPENEDLLEALKFARNYTYRRAVSLIAPPATWPNPTTRRFDQVVTLLNRFTYDLIDKSRTAPLASNDILTHLLQARDAMGQGMTDQQIHDELLTMFFSAYEDVANVLVWAFYLLAQHPQLVVTAHEEATRVFAQSPLTLESLHNLPTISNIIAETLRLYPPTWSSLRVAQAETRIRGYAVPKGAVALLNVYLLHRNPNFWVEPGRFDPERFAGDRAKAVDNPAYLPFGVAPRNCIGESLAVVQLKLNLALILQKFQVNPKTGGRVTMETDATLRIRGGLQVRVTPW